jgi:hypothetical protein
MGGYLRIIAGCRLYLMRMNPEIWHMEGYSVKH